MITEMVTKYIEEELEKYISVLEVANNIND